MTWYYPVILSVHILPGSAFVYFVYLVKGAVLFDWVRGIDRGVWAFYNVCYSL